MKKRSLLSILGLILPLVLVLGGCGDEKGDNNPLSPLTDSSFPKIINVSPVNGAAYLGVSTKIKITFDRDMEPSSLFNNFECWTDTSSPKGTKSYDDDAYTFTFAPNPNLYGGKSYYFKMKKGARDKAGNTMASDSDNYIFYTGPPAGPDGTSPFVELVSPANGETEVAAALTTLVSVTFTKAMDTKLVEKNITFSPDILGDFSWTGNTLTLTPSTALLGSTIYTVIIGTGAKDSSGNPLTTPFSWSFTTTVPGHDGAVEIYALEDDAAAVVSVLVTDEDLTSATITVTVSVKGSISESQTVTLTRVSHGAYRGDSAAFGAALASGDIVVAIYIDEKDSNGELKMREDTYTVPSS